MGEPFGKKPMITILGIGNTLYSDEGVGIHALPLLEEAFKGYDNVELVEGSTDGIKLLGPVESADYLIVIDAINAGKEGGSLILLYDDEIPAYYGIKMSIHQVSFQEVLFAAKLRDAYPKQIVMIGVQPVSLELGIELSDAVRSRLPDLVAKVKEQVDAWMEKALLVSYA